jgi:plasmid stability protein
MSVMIQIRHVPDDIHKNLKIRAIKKGMSLSDYLLSELVKIVKRPTLEDILARIEAREPVNVQESSVDAVRAEREAR